MPSKRRIRLSLRRGEAMMTHKVSIGRDKLVYVLLADRKLSYGQKIRKKSRIVYIGTTKTGISRIAQSVAARAEDIFSIPGVMSFHVRIVTCRPRRRVKTWRKLERALLISFREHFGEVPLCNSHGKKMRRTNEFQFFAEAGIKSLIEELS
jgi:hypothetical protein